MATKLMRPNSVLFCLVLCFTSFKLAASNAFVPIEEFSAEIAEDDSVAPIVTVRNGQIRGFRRDLDPVLEADKVLFEQADIFLGIPFAQPPVDNLRLERPLSAQNWNGTFDATAMPPPCVPQNMLTALNFDENCLQLNVMSPSPVPSVGDAVTRRLPVLVFIHGGAFIMGGTFVEGYANISNNFVAQGIVVVTIQYRLSFLGFFTDGTDRSPGNIGLWDQRQALLWVRDNIGAFGGDPNRVTVWGQSAGAASTSILALSPLTRDLFQQSIQMSGSSFCPWAVNDLFRDGSVRMAGAMGCGINGEQNVRDCVKRVELEDLVEALQGLEMIRFDLAMTHFNPRVDGQFVPSANLSALIRMAPPKPTLMGFTPHEALFLTIQNPNSVLNFQSALTVTNLNAFGRNQFVRFIQKIIHLEPIMRKANARREAKVQKRRIVQELIKFYASEAPPPPPNDQKHWLKQYTLFLSDVLFIVPTLAEAQLKAGLGWPVFLHQFDHVNKGHAKLLPFPAVAHTAEYAFTLGVPLLGNYELDDEDKRVRAAIAHAYGSFVKNGVPTMLNGETDWPQLGPRRSQPLRMVRIKYPNPVAETEPTDVTEKMQFWRKLFTMKGYGAVTGFTKEIL